MYSCKWRCLQVIMCLFYELAVCSSQKVTKNVLITADDEKLRDPEGYAAIAQLHMQMDDDQSGSIDRHESTDFLKEDMQLGGSDRARRERVFHHNSDELITVDDLWESWFASDERSWTTADLARWLESSVRLPQYVNVFIGMEIDGRALPRMAVVNSTYLSSYLGIKNPVHKQKIRLKALDVVLFGFSDQNSSRAKDVALSVMLIVLITVLVVLKKQRSRSHMQMEQLTSKLSQLKSMQSQFEDVQQKFDEEQKRRQSNRDSPESEQMETLRSQLLEAERLLETSGTAPLALQPLLRRTCELEMSYVGQQRMECIAEMREAIEHIDKLRKKQSSIVSSIKLATGASSGTGHIDSRIFSLKARMEKISMAMTECQHRWTDIESMCGFPILTPSPGAEIAFGTHPNGANISRNGSNCSFYRNSDLVGGSSTTSAASSANSGSSSTMVASYKRPAGCLCSYENTVQSRPCTLNTHSSKLMLCSDSNKRYSSHDDLKHSYHPNNFYSYHPRCNAAGSQGADLDSNSEYDSQNSIQQRMPVINQEMKELRRSSSNAIFRSVKMHNGNDSVSVDGKQLKSTESRRTKIAKFFRKTK